MLYLRLTIIAIAAMLIYSFTGIENPYPPFTVHVFPNGTGCTGSQVGAKVHITWTGGNSFDCTTDGTGSCGTGIQSGSYVDVYASYGTHHGQLCSVIQTEGGASPNLCLNDASCCIPHYKYFGYNFDTNN